MTITISPPSSTRHQDPSGSSTIPSPLPQLLHTPLGLALIELQGSINHPAINHVDDPDGSVTVGRLVFPDYNGEPGEGSWTKKVWLYIGEHQRLTGEVKKLPKPLGVLRKRAAAEGRGLAEGGQSMIEVDEGEDEGSTELEIAEIIKWKVVFSLRPEPVGVV